MTKFRPPFFSEISSETVETTILTTPDPYKFNGALGALERSPLTTAFNLQQRRESSDTVGKVLDLYQRSRSVSPAASRKALLR